MAGLWLVFWSGRKLNLTGRAMDRGPRRERVNKVQMAACTLGNTTTQPFIIHPFPKSNAHIRQIYTLYRISFNSLSSGKFCMKIQNCLNSVFNDFIHRDILVLVIEPVIVVNNLRLVAKFYFGNWSLCRKTVSTLSTNYLIDLIATTNFFSQMAITFTFANGNYFFSFHSLHCTA